MQFISGLAIYTPIEQIIEDVRLELHANNIDLLKDVKETGHNLMVTCPVHGDGMERNPSCGILLVEKQVGNRVHEPGTVNCFTCGYTAELPQFISYLYGRNDGGIFGFKWLSQRYVNIDIEERKPVIFNFNQDDEVGEEETLTEYVPDWELEKYRYSHPYMYERGLTDEIITYFDVGYDAELEAITFPVKDKDGNCLFVQKRYVPTGKNGYSRFHNDEGANKETLYGLDKIYENIEWVKEKGYVVIVESPIDVLTLWKWGEPAIGTMQSKPTETQIRFLNELPIQTLISAQDNDKAGIGGANTLRKECRKLVKRLKFPEGRGDINEMTYQEWQDSDKSIVF